MKKTALFLLLFTVLFCVAVRAEMKNVSVWVDGDEVRGAFLEQGTTYVTVRAFCNAAGAKSVSWNGKARSATAQGGTELTVYADKPYIIANGRYIYTENTPRNIDGTLYMPVRKIAAAYNGNVEWDGEAKRVCVTLGEALMSGSEFYSENDVYWLSRIIHAESCGQPFDGLLAVGCVVMNRAESEQFPNDIYGVIFDNKYGVQFTPTKNGTINKTPDEHCIIAAKLCLDGARILPDALYFMNEQTAVSKWVSRNRQRIVKIGDHTFFK